MNLANHLIQVSLLGEAIDNSDTAVFVADENMSYIAANAYACQMLGYERAELLRLKVADVARYDEAPNEYGDMMRTGWRDGSSLLTRKDGSSVRFRYRAGRTTVAGMPVFVSVGAPEDA